MKNLSLTLAALAFIVLGMVFTILPGPAQNQRVGGFTPNPEITFSFPTDEYPPGGSAPANVSITGPTNGTYTISIKNSNEDEVATIDLVIGGEPGSNQGTVEVPLPTEIGPETFTASFTIGAETATDSAEVLIECEPSEETLNHTEAVLLGNIQCGPNGWTYDTQPGQVTIRTTQCDGSFQDENKATDWVLMDGGSNDQGETELVFHELVSETGQKLQEVTYTTSLTG